MPVKKCNDCGIEKELTPDNWKGNNNSRDGYQHTCRVCKTLNSQANQHSRVKIKHLYSDLEEAHKKYEALKEELAAWKVKCETAENKYKEFGRKIEMMELDKKAADNWPRK